MRFIFRSLLKSPSYALIALATLALGIGVNTSMFSIVDALLFRSGPFPEPERLVKIQGTARTGELRDFSFTEIRELKDFTRDFLALTTIGRTQFALGAGSAPAEHVGAVFVSDDFFATFGVQPMLGRAFVPEEFRPGANHVVILSHAFWRDHFGGDQSVIGQTLRLDGANSTVVGVMPPAFDYALLWNGAAMWRPVDFTRDQREWRDYRAFELMGRLRPGASIQSATAALAPLAAMQAKEHPESYTGIRYATVNLQESLLDKLGRRITWMLFAFSGFVLLIACANLANLQLARTAINRRDLAIRAALGATRWRLLRHLLAESVVLALIGGACGVLVALALNRIVVQALTSGGGLPVEVRLNGNVLLVTLLVALLTGILFGIVPALLGSRTDVSSELKQQSRGSTGGRGQARLRGSLIVVEVALALVLLGGAAMLQHGFDRLLDHRSGWDADRLVVGSLPVPETHIDTDPKRNVLYRKIERELASIPGVEHAAVTTSLPIFGYNGDRQVLTEGQTPSDQLPAAFHVMVSPDYFATLGITLVEGRLFAESITEKDRRVIVINEALAHALWPNRSALGQRIGSMDSGKPYWAEVIGVVRDVEPAASLQAPSTRYQIYKPLVHEPWSYVYLVVRAAPGMMRPDLLGDSLRRAVAQVDADLVVDGIGTVRQTVNRQQRNLVLAGQVLAGFALLGLALAAVGIYGVISNLVAQRTGEFGIRLALGARPADLLALVLKHGLVLTALGAAVGLGGAFAVQRLLAASMPRLETGDPRPLLAVCAGLFVVALAACLVPAYRATKVDPLDALRAE